MIAVRLLDEDGRAVDLRKLAGGRPLVALVFGGPNDDEGALLLRDFRDATLAFKLKGIRVVGIALNEDPMTFWYLRRERGLGFPLLSDTDGSALQYLGLPRGASLLDADLHVQKRAPTSAEMLAHLRRMRPVGLRAKFRAWSEAIRRAVRPRPLVR